MRGGGVASAICIWLLNVLGLQISWGSHWRCRLWLSQPREAKVLPFWSAFPQDSGVESRIHTKAELCFFCFIDDIVSSFVTVTSDRVSHTRVPASPLHNVEHWGTHLQRPFLHLHRLIPTNLLLEGEFRQDFSVICPVSERVLFYLIAFCWGK